MSKNLFKAYTKPIKRKDLFKVLEKSSQAISEISIYAVKQSKTISVDRKTQNKIIESNLKSAKLLRSLFIPE